MKYILCLMLAALTLCVSLAGCAESKRTDTVSYENQNSITVEKVNETMNNISFDEKLLKYISEKSDGNYMVSPLSFRYALGLLIAGAEGETKAELLNALGVKNVDEWTGYCTKFNEFVRFFDDELKKDIERFESNKQNRYIPQDAKEPFRALRVANSIWKCDTVKEDFKPHYNEYIFKNYAAEHQIFSPSNAVKLINDWANRKTEGMIPELLSDNYDTEDLAVVLMNALYFKDSWQYSFNKFLTKDDVFITNKGEKVAKTFMTQTKDLFYYADNGTELVVLPMESKVYMAFVIGNTDNIAKKISKAKKHSVQVTIPQIDLETSFNNGEFVEFLKSIGVNKAFDDKSADFSAMIDYPIYVDDIIQKTKIKLDEDGVEAAAVTAIMMNKATGIFELEKPFVFTADKPFSFYIYTTCNDTTALLFSGEIVE